MTIEIKYLGCSTKSDGENPLNPKLFPFYNSPIYISVMINIVQIVKLLLRKQILLLGIVLFFVNIISFIPFDLQSFLATRILTVVIVFIFFVIKIGHYSGWVYSVLILQIISSVGYYYYDVRMYALLFLIPSILTYLIISFRVLPKIQWYKIHKFQYGIYSVLYVANLVFHYTNVNNFNDLIDDSFVEYCVYAVGFVGMTMCLFVAYFKATDLGSTASYYTYATFAFVFADFCSMMAYYYQFFPARFYFVERVCYSFALCMFLVYSYYDFRTFKMRSNSTIKPSQDSIFY